MPTFQYRAAGADGRIVRGVLTVADAAAASAELTRQDLFPLRIAPAVIPIWRARVNRAALALVFRGLASLVAAGVPIARALAAQLVLVRGPLRSALQHAATALGEGRSVAQALAAEAGAIPPVVIGMVRAGERSGDLAAALEQVAVHLEHEAQLASRVRQALTYPLVLTATGFASVVLITTVVVPRFATILSDLGQELPAATRLLLAISTMVTNYGWLAALTLAGALIWLGAVAQTPDGRRRLHTALWSTPLVGKVRRALASARMLRAMSGMLASGMPVLPVLDGVAEAAGDALVTERLARVRSSVAAGQSLASALEREAVLIPAGVMLLRIGEESGALAAMSARGGELAAREAEDLFLATGLDSLYATRAYGYGRSGAVVADTLRFEDGAAVMRRYQYNRRGQRTLAVDTVIVPGGVALGEAIGQIRYVYATATGRLDSMIGEAKIGGLLRPYARIGFTYDRGGRLVGRNVALDSASSAELQSVLHYDSRGRLDSLRTAHSLGSGGTRPECRFGNATYSLVDDLVSYTILRC